MISDTTIYVLALVAGAIPVMIIGLILVKAFWRTEITDDGMVDWLEVKANTKPEGGLKK